ncbi:protein-glutamine gamma-glutamyltransferase [Frankia sp. Hr75.2]|nr:protein-glutamine gamma-glutamyltransferase [Frankia sp. Hr75.2]
MVSRGGREIVPRLALAAVAGFASGTVFLDAFPAGIWLAHVAAAALLPPAVVAVLTIRSGRVPVRVLVSVPSWLVVTLGGAGVLLFRHDGSSCGPVGPVCAAAGAAVDGWERMLDVTLPAPPTADLVVVPFVLTALAAGLSAELAVRTTARLVDLLPPAIALVAAVFVVEPDRSTGVAGAAAIATAGLLGTVARPRRQRWNPPQPADGVTSTEAWTAVSPDATAGSGVRPGGMRAVRSVAPAVSLLALAVVLAPFLAGAADRTPLDPRDGRRRPAHLSTAADPLAYVPRWLADPRHVLFELVTESADPVAAPVRLAALDQYDGRAWSSGDEGFLRVGIGIPEPGGFAAAGGRDEFEAGAEAEFGAGTGTVVQHITIRGLEGPYLPAIDRPVRVERSGGPLWVEPTTGMLGVDGAALGAVTDDPSYSVVSVPGPSPRAYAGGLALLTAATTGEVAPLIQPAPPTPSVLVDIARTVTATARSPYEVAYQLSQHLRSSYGLSRPLPEGRSLGYASGQIEAFLTDGGCGGPEQFATAFVLGARALGLPARLIVGFAVPPADHDGVRRVRGEDLLVWGEVAFTGAGWLPFHPTPGVASCEVREAAAHGSGAPPATSPAERPVPDDPPPPPRDQPPDEIVPVTPLRPAPNPWPWWQVLIAAAGGVIAGYLLVVMAAPAVRRRHRHRHGVGSQRRRLVAVWEDFLDDLDIRAAAVPRRATHHRVAMIGGTIAGSPRSARAADGLADAVTAALFSTRDVGADEVAAAHRHLADYRRASARGDGRTRLRRLRSRLAPRRIPGRRLLYQRFDQRSAQSAQTPR